MQYYVTTKDIQEGINAQKSVAQRIFREAKKLSNHQFTPREVPARLVNQIIGWKAFDEPQEER